MHMHQTHIYYTCAHQGKIMSELAMRAQSFIYISGNQNTRIMSSLFPVFALAQIKNSNFKVTNSPALSLSKYACSQSNPLASCNRHHSLHIHSEVRARDPACDERSRRPADSAKQKGHL